MNIVLILMSITILYLLWKTESSQKKIEQLSKERDEHVIKDGLTKMAIKKLKLKNELDRMSLPELIKSRNSDRQED